MALSNVTESKGQLFAVYFLCRDIDVSTDWFIRLLGLPRAGGDLGDEKGFATYDVNDLPVWEKPVVDDYRPLYYFKCQPERFEPSMVTFGLPTRAYQALEGYIQAKSEVQSSRVWDPTMAVEQLQLRDPDDNLINFFDINSVLPWASESRMVAYDSAGIRQNFCPPCPFTATVFTDAVHDAAVTRHDPSKL